MSTLRMPTPNAMAATAGTLDPVTSASALEPTLGAPSGAATLCQQVASSDLLKGRRSVEITHNGCIYRLSSTRMGKLILTK